MSLSRDVPGDMNIVFYYKQLTETVNNMPIDHKLSRALYMGITFLLSVRASIHTVR